ncbi:TetR/AcrR family transcriptional regulator [Anaerosporobacter sp.]|uniref:TetR/AcrR family transcriptional regulator n=1 Tax=Anaerosporobacter sp. TaxID=1872529 RepID=UPI00286F3063|nr:helix-turn-helix domain-containing protein [Anaerosporobacter sp.]
MARKTQISKEVILEAALKMLIRDGYSAINIKTLSKEIGCSTQPLVWHFENMEGLRKALSEYALNYANRKMCPSAENAVAAFEQVGRSFIHIAVSTPNLFRFLYLEGYSGSPADNFDALILDEDNAALIKRISKEFSISEENAGRYLQNTIIYTHGIATLAATGVINVSEKEMMQLVNCAADAFLVQEGVPLEKIPCEEETQK